MIYELHVPIPPLQMLCHCIIVKLRITVYYTHFLFIPFFSTELALVRENNRIPAKY